MVREWTAMGLSALLAVSPLTATAAVPSLGTIQGVVTVEGKPLSGMGVAVVDLRSGAIHRTRSDASGGYRVAVAPGDYVLTSVGLAGLAVGRAPARVVVAAGEVASASLDLMKLPVVLEQEPAGAGETPAAPGAIQHEAIGCVVEGQFPLIQALIEPASSVARARVYFKSALGDAYYFVEMTPAWDGKLPKPTLAASPITYYIQAVTTEFGESQTAEIQAQVVADASECPSDKKVAPIGPPGAVTVFSASTAAVVTPVGFAAAGGILAGGTLLAAGLGAGALAGGIAAATGGSDTTTTTQPAAPPPTTQPPVTTTTTTLPAPLPNCVYNEVTRDPINCPCEPVPVFDGTDTDGTPIPTRTCDEILGLRR